MSIVACERGFSKKYMIKDIKRTIFSIDTLDGLMGISLIGPHILVVEWEQVYEIRHNAKERIFYDM